MTNLTKALKDISDDIDLLICDKHPNCDTCPLHKPNKDCVGSIASEAYRQAKRVEERIGFINESAEALKAVYGIKKGD